MCKTGDLHRPGHATTIHHPASRASVGVRFAQTLVLAVGLPTAACGESEVPAATELRSALPWTQVPAKELFGNNVPASLESVSTPLSLTEVSAAVQVSGEVNLALVRLRGVGGAQESSLLRLDSTNSRVVFRGREQLSDG